MAEHRRVRQRPVAFEDLTTPDQRVFGVYLIRARNTGFAETFTGPYRLARKLARSRTVYGDVELIFVEAQDTAALD